MGFWIFMLLPLAFVMSAIGFEVRARNKRVYDHSMRIYNSCDGKNSSTEIKLSFKHFQSFYFADPDNWHMTRDDGSYLPYYYDKEKKTRVNIYFLNYREYKKFVKWYEGNLKKGVDYANTEATIELANMISDNVQARIQATTEQTVTAYEDMTTILNRINEERSKAHESISLTLPS